MKLFETKITVKMKGEYAHLDDESLEEMCDIIDQMTCEAADRIEDLIKDLAAEKGVELEVLVE